MTDAMRIAYLADYPGHVPTLASWIFRHWGRMYRMKSVEEQIERLSERLNKDKLPLALVALADSEPVGTASLKIREMTTHPHLHDWLGTVYVAEDHRNRGIGTALVRRAEEEAKRLGIGTLYLHTPDKEDFYAKRGWVAIERPVYYGMPVVVMKKRLAIAR